MMGLPEGLYEQVLTQRLASMVAALPASAALAALDGSDARSALVDEMARQLSRILDELDGDGAAKVESQLALVNALLVEVRRRLAADDRNAGTADLVTRVASRRCRTSRRPRHSRNSWMLTVRSWRRC